MLTCVFFDLRAIHGRAESLNLAMAATVCLYASARALHEA